MTTTVSNDPIINLPFLYVNGLQLSWVSNSTASVSSGQCRDSTNIVDIVIGATATVISTAFVGVNGLDSGTAAVSTDYNVFAISDSASRNPSGFLISTSAANPVMPSGYDSLRLIGRLKTNSSSQLILFYQTGNGSVRTYQWDSPIAVLTGGTSATFVAVPLTAGMPAIRSTVILNAKYTPAVAANIASLRPTGSSVAAASSPVVMSGAVAAVVQDFPPFTMLPLLATGAPSIDYVVTTSDALTLLVVGYVDNL